MGFEFATGGRIIFGAGAVGQVGAAAVGQMRICRRRGDGYL